MCEQVLSAFTITPVIRIMTSSHLCVESSNEPKRRGNFRLRFSCSINAFSKWKQDVFTKFGSAHGCAVRTGALKRDLFSKIKKRSERHSFGYFSLAVERKVTRRQRRNTNNKSYTSN